MKKLDILFTLVFILFGIFELYAVPAKPGIRTYVQPDGSTIDIIVYGNENFHFATKTDGTILFLAEDGFYHNGRIDDDGSIVYSESQSYNIKNINFGALKNRANTKRRAPQTGLGLFESASFPLKGSPKSLIILVEYQDVKFNKTYDPKEYFENLIKGENFNQYGSTGSALKYFSDQSSGQFTPDFDVLGPITLPNNMAYYGKNDSRTREDMRPEYMVIHALQELDETVDFSIYDTDKNGIIDNIYIFYAGQGEADGGSADSVWPHSWDVRFSPGYENFKVDGVTVATYACSNEWTVSTDSQGKVTEEYPCGIGTFVHEFSHVMGLPDLYHTGDTSVLYTPMEFSVLDLGPYNNNGRTPPNYGAYELNALGWFEPIMMTKPASISLNDISTKEFGLIPTEKNNEFFLFENRQQTGWDKFIPAHGMLVWHIDYNASVFEDNTVNNVKNHQRVDIVEANNASPTSWDSYDNLVTGYPFPGTSGKTSFTSSTNPALKSWDGKAIDYPVTNIEEIDGIITFDVSGGYTTLTPPLPFVNGWSESEMYFIAEWPPVEDATDYLISVFFGEGSEEEIMTNGFDDSSLPSGWVSTSRDYYTTSSNYGQNSPSLKFSSDGQTLTSPIMDGDISKIEFWIKGQSSSNGTALKLEGFSNGEWVKIISYEPEANKIANLTIDSEIPSGTRQIKFTMEKKTGNIALDDIRITYGGGIQILPDYNFVSTKNQNLIKVDKLVPGIKDYHFTVTATDGKHKLTSQPVYVTIKGERETTNIESIIEENELTVYYNLQGVRIELPSRGEIIIEKRGNKVRKIIF